MTVRDVRLHWPRAEQALKSGGELVVTRDGTPVARLLPVRKLRKKAPRFDGAAHLRWLESFWKRRRKGPSTDELLAGDREE
jgi:antitoxin (DNA-binding transcriptional repressor) of toxin-antitoxin stability system